jgi:hypothetical protein
MTNQLENSANEPMQFSLELLLRSLVVVKGSPEFTTFLSQYTKALDGNSILCHPDMGQDPLIELSEHHRLVAAFMLSAGQVIPHSPQRPSDEVLALRAKLQLEETLELIKGLGVTLRIDGTDIELSKETKITFTADQEFNLDEVIDGIADNRVISTGTGLACGVIVGDTTQREVDMNNLYKFREDSDGYTREDGKWVKPTDHPTPRLGLIQGFLYMVIGQYLADNIAQSEEASNDTPEV